MATVSDLVLLLHHKAFIGPMDDAFFDGYALNQMKVRASNDAAQSQVEGLDPGILDRTVDLTRTRDLKIMNLNAEHALDADEVEVEPVNIKEYDGVNYLKNESISHNSIRSSFSYQNRITSPPNKTMVRSSIDRASLREIHVCQP